MVYLMIYTPIICKKRYGKEFWLIMDFNIVLEWHQPVLMELCLIYGGYNHSLYADASIYLIWNSSEINDPW